MTGPERPACLIAARRTAVVPHGGAFARMEPWRLAAAVIGAALNDAALAASAVDEVVLGNALTGGGNVARLAALDAGLPETVPGLTVDRQCCGGLDAIILAARLITSGAARVVVAGGCESHSRRPHRLRRPRDPGESAEEYEQPPFSPWPDRDPDMHAAAARLARDLNVDRAAQGAYAIRSHEKARAARDSGRLSDEIVVMGEAPADHDPFTRRLSPRLCARSTLVAGDPQFGVDAATTAVAADAAAVVVVVDAAIAAASGRPALAVLDGACVGGPPEMPPTAPIAAIRRVCSALGVDPATIDCSEVMEAYAVQAIACIDGTGLDANRVNPGGGALARGHPIGASGAILAVRLWHELTRLPTGAIGLAAIAAAGGLGTAAVFRLSSPPADR